MRMTKSVKLTVDNDTWIVPCEAKDLGDAIINLLANHGGDEPIQIKIEQMIVDSEAS